jgi:hypothetical protein
VPPMSCLDYKLDSNAGVIATYSRRSVVAVAISNEQLISPRGHVAVFSNLLLPRLNTRRVCTPVDHSNIVTFPLPTKCVRLSCCDAKGDKLQLTLPFIKFFSCPPLGSKV